jgi:hypothetical protein
VPELNCVIPEQRLQQTELAAKVLGAKIHTDFPFLPGASPAAGSLVELALNRTWRPTLTVTGAAGMFKCVALLLFTGPLAQHARPAGVDGLISQESDSTQFFVVVQTRLGDMWTMPSKQVLFFECCFLSAFNSDTTL